MLGAVLALAIGAVAFRLRSLRGEIFALLTLAVPFILAAFARINTRIDGGQGIIVPSPDYPDVLGGFQDFLYLLNLAIATLAVGDRLAIQHSRFGWALAAIHDAEDVGRGPRRADVPLQDARDRGQRRDRRHAVRRFAPADRLRHREACST